MAARYWVGTSTSWDSTGNWSTSSGGSSGASVPGSSDDVYFDSTAYTDCTIDSNPSINSLTLTAGALDFADATMDCAANISFSGSQMVDMGTSVITCSGSFSNQNHDSTAWTKGSSTLILDGTSQTVYTAWNKQISDYVIETGASITNSASLWGDSLTVRGTLTQASSQYIRINDTVIESSGKITGNSYINVGSGSLTFGDGTLDIWVLVGGWDMGTLEPNTYRKLVRFDNSSPSTRTFTPDGTGDFVFQGDFHSNCTGGASIIMDFATYNNNITFEADVLRTGDLTWQKGTGGISFEAGTDQTADFGDGTIEEVTIHKTAGTVLFNDGFTSDAFLMDSTNAGGVDFGDGTSVFVFAGDFDVQCTTGSVDLGTADISVGGDWLNNPFAGTWTYGTSTVRFAGTSKTFFARFSNDIYNLIVEGTYTGDSGKRLEVLNSLTIDTGASLTFNESSYLVANNTTAIINGTLDGDTTAGSLTTLGDVTIGTTGSVTINKLGIRNSDITINGNGVLSPTSNLYFLQDSAIQGSATTIVINTPSVTLRHEGGATKYLTISTPVKFTGDVDFIADDPDGYVVDINADLEFQSNLAITETTGSFSWLTGANTLSFTGSNDQTVDLNNLFTIEDIDIDKTSGTLTFNSGLSTGNLDITDGTVDFSTYTYNIYESWSGQDSTNVNYSNATVYLVGPQIYPSLGSGISGNADVEDFLIADETMDGGIEVEGRATQDHYFFTSGGSILGPINYRVTGTDCSGDYLQSGFYFGYPAYLREDSAYWITWSFVYDYWNICSTKGGANFGFSHWWSYTLEGTYAPSGKIGEPIVSAFSNEPYTIFNIDNSSGIELSGLAEITTEEEETDVVEGSGGCLAGGAEADVWRIVNCDAETYRCYIKERDEFCVPPMSFKPNASAVFKVIDATPAIVAGIILCRMENEYTVSGEEYDWIFPEGYRFDVFEIPVDPKPTLQLDTFTPVPNIAAMTALTEENKKLIKKKVYVEQGTNVEPTLSKEIRIALAARKRPSCRRCRH
jgi:hypothetical protein